jgi:hypothetical protein
MAQVSRQNIEEFFIFFHIFISQIWLNRIVDESAL